MLEAFEVQESVDRSPDKEIVLTYDERQKSRHKAETSDGNVLGWFLERGKVLADGHVLVCGDGTIVRVVAAPEPVSNVRCEGALAMAKAAYHLGNRHVPLQIEDGFLRFLHDHVLDEMLRGLGLSVDFANAPFHPEPGAYAHGDHSHGDEHQSRHAH